MENQETNQETFINPTNLTNLGNKPEKTCKTCSKQKGITKGNIAIMSLSFGVLFLAFYGLIQLSKDVISLFTR
jgi:hypothetical protein